MTTRVLSIDAIVQDPQVRGGRPVIAGTGLRVSDLATYHVAEGLTPDELAVQFGLELAQVHAALSYYYSHSAEIDDEIRDNARQAERWHRKLGERATGG
jgi:uncharacterized protein (DUF433 family)